MTNKLEELPCVVVLVGLPGSGKSFARNTAVTTGASSNSYQYSTDDLIEILAGKAGKTYTEGFEEFSGPATKMANEELGQAIDAGRGIIWDQTNMSDKKRGKILSRFKKGYRRECICILPPFTAEQQIELERRLKDRPGKEIPNFVMANMLKSFVLPSLEEGFNRVMYFDIYGNKIDDGRAAELFGKKD